MISLLLATTAAFGTFLVLTPGPTGDRAPLARWTRLVRSGRTRLRLTMDQAGLEGVSLTQFLLASVAVGGLAVVPAFAVFGPGLPAVTIACVAAAVPAGTWRRRREARRRAARDAWPRLIEELRVLVGSVGRSMPQALIEVGLRGPEELRPAFRAAQREWALTTDFERTTSVLKTLLADPTADVTCETLLIAADVGGDIDPRLQALAEDRRKDLMDRKEARARQAGARLARSFVVVVPAGMALAGLSVGDGRAAYATATGQTLVALGIAIVIACWWWAGRIMHLPDPERVFDR